MRFHCEHLFQFLDIWSWAGPTIGSQEFANSNSFTATNNVYFYFCGFIILCHVWVLPAYFCIPFSPHPVKFIWTFVFHKFFVSVHWTYLIIESESELIYIHLFFSYISTKWVNINLTFEEKIRNEDSRTYVSIFSSENVHTIVIVRLSQIMGMRSLANIFIIMTYWF